MKYVIIGLKQSVNGWVMSKINDSKIILMVLVLRKWNALTWVQILDEAVSVHIFNFIFIYFFFTLYTADET